MEILNLTDENFEEKVLNSNKTVLVDFYADWCGPCKMMSPIIDELAKEIGDKVKIGKVNVDENQKLAIEYLIMSIPTIVIIKNGEVAKSILGVRPKEEILKVLEQI